VSDEAVFLGTVKKRMVGNTCRRCGKPADGGTAFDIDQQPPASPKPGDYTICLYCGELSCFDAGMKPVALTRKARRILRRDPRLKRVLEIAADAATKVRRTWQ
jgi:hypothetical protein